MILANPSLAKPSPELGHELPLATAQLESARTRSLELQQQTRRVLAEAQAARRSSAEARRERRSSPEGQGLLQRSDYVRLLAQLETMPVIEQAKGIIMSQSRCGATEAFEMLRRASQRSNVPVRDLAAQIVANAATGSHAPQSFAG